VYRTLWMNLVDKERKDHFYSVWENTKLCAAINFSPRRSRSNMPTFDCLIEPNTRKRGNRECIPTWGLATQRQFLSALVTTPAKFEVAEPTHCSIIAFLLLIYYFTLWPWTMTLNICNVSPVTLWNFVPNLNAILSNPPRSSCDFKHTCYMFSSAPLCDNFH